MQLLRLEYCFYFGRQMYSYFIYAEHFIKLRGYGIYIVDRLRHRLFKSFNLFLFYRNVFVTLFSCNSSLCCYIFLMHALCATKTYPVFVPLCIYIQFCYTFMYSFELIESPRNNLLRKRRSHDAMRNFYMSNIMFLLLNEIM